MDLSVIVCSHNPRPDYLNRTLAALRNQTLPQGRWEFLLIDNASEVSLAPKWDLSWHSNARHLLEEELGIATARRRGIQETNGDVLLFVDDDNVLAPNYLAEALRLCKRWPRLGTWGSGAIVPEFEREPPDFVKSLLPYLALREAAAPCWGNIHVDEATPWGAGLCLRREVAIAYCRDFELASIPILSRRGKQSLLGGEDIEMSHIACEMGFGMGVFPSLKLTHLIPKERVTAEYLLRMLEGSTTTNYLLWYNWNGSIPINPIRFRGLLSIAKNVITTDGFDRRIYLTKIRAIMNARREIRRVMGDSRSKDPPDPSRLGL